VPLAANTRSAAKWREQDNYAGVEEGRKLSACAAASGSGVVTFDSSDLLLSGERPRAELSIDHAALHFACTIEYGFVRNFARLAAIE
jgi:hypothetical protein